MPAQTRPAMSPPSADEWAPAALDIISRALRLTREDAHALSEAYDASDQRDDAAWRAVRTHIATDAWRSWRRLAGEVAERAAWQSDPCHDCDPNDAFRAAADAMLGEQTRSRISARDYATLTGPWYSALREVPPT